MASMVATPATSESCPTLAIGALVKKSRLA
jgi:hypothetical protein